jgi:hypothetical protein
MTSTTKGIGQMHYAYFNSFHTYCHDFAGNDEIVFMIALCVLAKLVDHSTRVFDLNVAITHFRDHGCSLYAQVYAGVEAAWGSCTRGYPPLAMKFVNDPVDEPLTREASKVRRQMLWNAIMGELRFSDRVDLDQDADVAHPMPVPTRSELQGLIRRVVSRGLWDRLERALAKNLNTPGVRQKLAVIPLGEDHELPDLELELDRQRRVLDPTYLVCREDTPEDLKAVFQQYLEIVGV